MAGSLNKVMLIGNLGKDPDVNHTNDGRLVVNLSIATSETWKDKNSGERRERTEWHRVVVFNENLAGIAQKYLVKGSKVCVEGKMQTRKWTDQQGVEKYTTEVVLGPFGSSLVLLDRKGAGGPPAADDPDDYGTTRSREYADPQAPPRDEHGRPDIPGREYDYDDEIPF